MHPPADWIFVHFRKFQTMRLAAFFCLLNLPIALTAQITITETDLPSSNQNYFVSTANPANQLDFQQTGNDYTWDYSSLTQVTQNELSFVSPSSVPFTYQFLFNNPFDEEHLADFAQAQPGFGIGDQFTLEEFYAFFQKSQTDYRIVGLAGTINGIPLPAQTNPVDIIYDLPLEYGNTGSHYSEWFIQVPTLFSYKLKQTRNYEADGWGMLTTPYGTFEAVRVRMEIDAIDSIAIEAFNVEFENPRNSVEYHWLGANEGVPLLKVTETMGVVTAIEYKSEEIPDNIKESSTAVLSLYPNPANERLFIQFPMPSSRNFEVFDAQGRRVLTGNSSIQLMQLDVADFSPGMYIFRTDEGLQQRFLVQK